MRKFEHPSIIVASRLFMFRKPNAFLIISFILLLFASILALDNPIPIVFKMDLQCSLMLQANFRKGSSLLWVAIQKKSSRRTPPPPCRRTGR